MIEEVKEQSKVLEHVKKTSRTLELILGIRGGFFGLPGVLLQ